MASRSSSGRDGSIRLPVGVESVDYIESAWAASAASTFLMLASRWRDPFHPDASVLNSDESDEFTPGNETRIDRREPTSSPVLLKRSGRMTSDPNVSRNQFKLGRNLEVQQSRRYRQHAAHASIKNINFLFGRGALSRTRTASTVIGLWHFLLPPPHRTAFHTNLVFQQ
jgi:hypothetical protein